jgi:isoleucyl-tRNA synthetase
MNLKEIEQQVSDYWDQEKIFDQLKKKNKDNRRWSFLDGPITANNPMGVHHAWGRTLKDLYQRYWAMNGRKLLYRNGFDCQGLWVEVEVEKELGLKNKQEIENLVPGDPNASIAKFVNLCKQRVDKFAKIQTEQSKRLGYWMNWDEKWDNDPGDRLSYFTMSSQNNYAIWKFLKKCHLEGKLYQSNDVMPWCPRCATGISHMEMHEGYKETTHQSAYVLLPITRRAAEYLLVWTTMPWTLLYNQAAAVNPSETYVKIDIDDKYIWVSRKTVEKFKGYKELETCIGSDFFKWKYVSPFGAEINPIIGWRDVNAAEGTGIVHIAPSCGPEDYKLGKENKFTIGQGLDENGCVSQDVLLKTLDAGYALNGLSGNWKDVNEWIIGKLKGKGILYRKEKITHSYPHCWRCGTELVHRLVDEWFIKMDWRDEIISAAKNTKWIPEFGLQRELDWLQNMGDWMISKKRYWGLALPIWKCECGWVDVVGGLEELCAKCIDMPKEFSERSPHRPWIDLIKLRCHKCNKEMTRIKDVGNPWLDAGIVALSTMSEHWYPAEVVIECFPGQFRNWFYALLAMSTMMKRGEKEIVCGVYMQALTASPVPAKTILGHALVKDSAGEEMHKTKGNSIPFAEAADKMGVDTMRWMFARQNPANDLLFGYAAGKEIYSKFISKLMNCHSFYKSYADVDKYDPEKTVKIVTTLDRWIISELNIVVKAAKEGYESYNIKKFCELVESFVNDKLSNWYVRRSRRRFWKAEMDDVKRAGYQTLRHVLTTLCKILAPAIPFLAEYIHLDLMKQSVHLEDFPQAGEIDEQLNKDVQTIIDIVSKGLALRNEAKIKVRQPLSLVVILMDGDNKFSLSHMFNKDIREELNVRSALFTPTYKVDESEKEFIKQDNIILNVNIDDSLRKEGYVREITRHTQELRKKVGCTLTDRIELSIVTDSELIQDAIGSYESFIMEETLATKLHTKVNKELVIFHKPSVVGFEVGGYNVQLILDKV